MHRVGGVSRGVREDAVGIYEGMMASSRTVGKQAGRGGGVKAEGHTEDTEHRV